MTSTKCPSLVALYRIAQIRQIETAAKESLPAGSLMRAAGKAAAEFAKKLIRAPNEKILVLAGPGDNGGDALEAAQLLASAGFQITIILCDVNSQYSIDAQQSLQSAQASRATFIDIEHFLNGDKEQWGLVIDGIFGIGLTRAISGTIASLTQRVNQLSQKYRIPVLALDVPSGLNADTGQPTGEVAILASHTITFIGNKPGLHTAAGRDYSGQVEVADLAISSNFFPKPSAFLTHPQMFAHLLKPRLNDSHKGSYGDVMIIGGAAGMAGAPILAARSAIHCGAGRVFIGFIGTPVMFDNQHPELMCRNAKDLDFSRSVVVIGPGLGTSDEAKQVLSKALDDAQAMVIDADALNLIALDATLQNQLSARHEKNLATIMTPHPLEAARLLAVSTKEIQADRLNSAQSLANKFKSSVILKGAGTVIATLNGTIYINTTGNPALATAGTGDVLAGVCGALLAQAASASDAASFAVWLHGLAADNLVDQRIGTIGLTASELIPAIRFCLNTFVAVSNGRN
ncbi:MAG: NAD(P)H-hydrate dehydratase [Pseudomonadota bacterium]